MRCHSTQISQLVVREGNHDSPIPTLINYPPRHCFFIGPSPPIRPQLAPLCSASSSSRERSWSLTSFRLVASFPHMGYGRGLANMMLIILFPSFSAAVDGHENVVEVDGHVAGVGAERARRKESIRKGQEASGRHVGIVVLEGGALQRLAPDVAQVGEGASVASKAMSFPRTSETSRKEVTHLLL
mmetsp:Transcript_8994/g.29185  ORF Transcript_8994/g.29185 Transcript_8994/m.29185 type:complete len:185 (+) Transcript_8994:189-743(+)